MNRLFLYFFLLSFSCVVGIGCGDGKIGVTGFIRYEGKTPEEGSITFNADNGKGASYSEMYTQGKYRVRVPEGTYLVRISGKKRVPLDTPIPAPQGGPPITHKVEMVVPEAYGRFSTLQVTVSKSARTHDFDLNPP